MNRAKLFSVSVFCVFLFIVFPSEVFGQTQYLREGIGQYKQENYEEAAEILIKAREQDPKSSTAAFFLGLTYKQMMDYPKALENFRAAVTLTPRIKEALVEVVDIASQLGEVEEARKWISVAEEEGIAPAKIAFLKGQILMKEGKYPEAVKSFEKAMSLDKSYTQSAELQIGLCYMKQKDLKTARERFRAAMLKDPESDLATFARQYQDMVEKRIELARPFRLTLAVNEQYNTNLLSNPKDPAYTDSPDERTYLTVPSVRLNYVPTLRGPWLFTAQYAFSANFHDKFSNSRNTISNSISMVPGYNFGRLTLNLSVSYSHSMLRGPSYIRYTETLGFGPLLRILVTQNQILELFGGYNYENYFHPPEASEDDQDSRGPSAYISWIWLFEDIFLNLKAEYIDDRADGIWWENDGYKFSLNTALPVIDKVKLQLSGEAFYQDYRRNHLLLDNEARRHDKTHTGSAGLTWEFFKDASLVVQYTRTWVNSNIGYYDYEQEVYNSGIEYRY